MASFKANGDPLEGALALPGTYPNPVLANVNMHSMDWAYGDGNSLIDTTGPTAPVLSDSDVQATQVTLSWTAATDAGSGVGSYDVYNGATKVTSQSALTYTVTGLTTATAYTFKVVANDKAGNTTASNTLDVTTS